VRFGAPDRAELYFPRFRRAVRLFARAPGKFRGSHGNTCPVEAQVKSGRQRFFPQWLRVEPFIGGDLLTERFGATLDLTGINADAGQFPQQLAAFLKADHRTDCSNHADGGRRKAGFVHSQVTVARTESAFAVRAVIVGTIQVEFSQDALENLAPASGIASGVAAVAGERRARLIRSVGVEALLDGARRQAQNLSPRSGLDGFEIYAIGGAATQQRIHFNCDVASQLGGE
jgi:hypothetical protein